MRSIVAVLAVLAVLGMAVGGLSLAQETPATPGAGSDLCAPPVASPGASPEASPEGSPDVVTDASPAVVATEVVEEIEGGLASVVCATPGADGGVDGQASAGTLQLDAYDIGWRTADQPGPQVALTLSPGTTIEITNTGVAPHNFDLQALGIFVDLPPGGAGEAAISADAPLGQYEFICSVPGHAPAGMVGTITIQ